MRLLMLTFHVSEFFLQYLQQQILHVGFDHFISRSLYAKPFPNRKLPAELKDKKNIVRQSQKWIPGLIILLGNYLITKSEDSSNHSIDSSSRILNCLIAIEAAFKNSFWGRSGCTVWRHKKVISAWMSNFVARTLASVLFETPIRTSTARLCWLVWKNLKSDRAFTTWPQNSARTSIRCWVKYFRASLFSVVPTSSAT